jgi:hypothetical protein
MILLLTSEQEAYVIKTKKQAVQAGFIVGCIAFMIGIIINLIFFIVFQQTQLCFKDEVYNESKVTRDVLLQSMTELANVRNGGKK